MHLVPHTEQMISEWCKKQICFGFRKSAYETNMNAADELFSAVLSQAPAH